MLAILIHRAARPFVRLWITESALSWRSLPVPHDTPLTHAAGSDPDRVLLIGSGPAVSYGVVSHNVGLAGGLARALSALTGRGVSVRVRASGELTVPEATATLRDMDLSQFGAVVSTLGGMEAMTLVPLHVSPRPCCGSGSHSNVTLCAVTRPQCCAIKQGWIEPTGRMKPLPRVPLSYG